MNIRGIDNVLLSVGDLDAALEHYVVGLGFRLKFKLAERGIAVLAIGDETPGLVLKEEQGDPIRAGKQAPKLWVEVASAKETAEELVSRGIALLSEPFPAGTGWVVEVADAWGNVIGFADYSLRPELGR